MKLRDAIEELEGLRYLIARLPLQSAPARRHLMALPWLADSETIGAEIDRTRQAILFCRSEEALVATIQLKLHQLRDIHGTIRNIVAGNTPDDIELFELKHFWLIADDIRQLLSPFTQPLITLPDTAAVLAILDPEATRVPSFYLYDCYDATLANLRRQVAEARRHGEKTLEETLRDELLSREDTVRQKIGEQLHHQHPAISSTMTALARLDILLAKALLSAELHLNLPTVATEGETRIEGLFNPHIKQRIESQGQHYQPVNIAFEARPVLITGANMGGKTVLLNTVALAQMLTQFGFPVPATSAHIVPVDRVMLSSGDNQSVQQGLSSYAAEMLRINNMLKATRDGQRILALVDEPARTTNPTEGEALAQAIVSLLTKLQVRSLITTHYSSHHFGCTRLRVKGFTGKTLPGNVTPETLSQHFDYTLETDSGEQQPREALRIARILGIDEELTALAETQINNRKLNNTK